MSKIIYITCRRDGYHYYDRQWRAGETRKAKVANVAKSGDPGKSARSMAPKARTGQGCELVISETEYRVHMALLQRCPNHPIAFLDKAPEDAPVPALADRAAMLNEQSRELAKLGAEADKLRKEVAELEQRKEALATETQTANEHLESLQARVLELESQVEEMEA